MANGFMQEYPGPASTQNHRHGSGRCRFCVEIDESLMDRFFGIVFQDIIGEIGVIEPPTTTCNTLLATTILLRDDLQRDSYQWSDIRCH